MEHHAASSPGAEMQAEQRGLKVDLSAETPSVLPLGVGLLPPTVARLPEEAAGGPAKPLLVAGSGVPAHADLPPLRPWVAGPGFKSMPGFELAHSSFLPLRTLNPRNSRPRRRS